jgi:hypothetical protein
MRAYVGALSGAIPGNAKAENAGEILYAASPLLIVGGGMTADAAIQGIRKVDSYRRQGVEVLPNRDAARAVIGELGPFRSADLMGRLAV